MTKEMHRYEPRSPLQAIDPKAFFWLFADPPDTDNEERDDATIVTIRGPLSQHDDWWQDSYESIRSRVLDACEKAPQKIIMRIDSPGGDVAGCFDAARAIRTMCQVAEKELIVHVEGRCCSAAYALATAADRIVASRTAELGSIGVIAVRLDESRAMEESGYKVTLITSGARKADGYPCIPMSKDELAAFQADIDSLAGEFFDLVSVRRRLSVDEIAAFEAASFRGDAALKAGLVDELGSFDNLLATLGGSQGEMKTMSKEEEARAALEALAEDEDSTEEQRARARKGLAALDGEEEPEDGDSEPEGEDEEEEPDAEGEEDDKETAAAAPSTVSASTAASIAAHGSNVERRLERLERKHEAEERDRLIAAHGNVSKGLSKLLASKPLSEVKAILAELPKAKKPKLGDAAATTTVAGTRGGGERSESRLSPEESLMMDKAMGLHKASHGIVKRGSTLYLGAELREGEVSK